MKRLLLLLPLALLATACQDQDPAALTDGPQFAQVPDGDLSAEEALGKAIYFDVSLSLRNNQSCATCHDPEFGFTGPNPGTNLRGSVYPGSVKYLFGNRKPPSAAYATTSPIFHIDEDEGIPVGGNFWDGRATGDFLGNPAADQAIGPFLNPVEQALPHAACVIYRIAEGPYAGLWDEAGYPDLPTGFPQSLGKMCRDPDAWAEIDAALGEALAYAVDVAYGKVGLAIAAFEGSNEVNAFSSKWDAYEAGLVELTEEEQMGMELFFNEEEGGGKCSLCHPPPDFTDYTYDNLGIPANPLSPAFGTPDLGLGAFLRTVPASYGLNPADFDGAVKVPTLRNVAKAPGRALKAFGHNGVFKSLEHIVHFYNTRDALPACEGIPTSVGDLLAMGFESDCWPAPEVPQNVNDE
jgi:cytochrome c peroxidase